MLGVHGAVGEFTHFKLFIRNVDEVLIYSLNLLLGQHGRCIFGKSGLQRVQIALLILFEEILKIARVE